MQIKPPAILLCGDAGAGKTYSLSTLIEAGLEVFCLFTDPGGEETFIDSIIERGLDKNKAHWAYVPITTQDWEDFTAISRLVHRQSYSSLGEIKTGINKQQFTEIFDVLSIMSNFKCERTGKEYGAVDDWGPDRAFVLDSITGLGMMFKHLVVGAKPTLHQGEWGVAMNQQEEFIVKLVSSTRCTTVVTAHMERQTNEMLGHTQLMPSFLGNKLAPKIPRLFSDVVLAYQESGQFKWSTTEDNAALKARNFPISSKLEPTFVPAIERWRKRNEMMEDDAVKSNATTSSSDAVADTAA